MLIGRFSLRQSKALITKWLAVTPTDEVDDLSDFDWLCQCQDWDSPTSSAPGSSATDRLGPGRRAATVSLGSRHAPLRFVLQQAGGQWLIDDIFREWLSRRLAREFDPHDRSRYRAAQTALASQRIRAMTILAMNALAAPLIQPYLPDWVDAAVLSPYR